jgi:hypothetical protein
MYNRRYDPFHSTEKKLVMFLISVGSILLNGCQKQPMNMIPTATPSPEYIDHSLLTGEPCSPPCWNGLIPGQSSEEEVRSIVESLSFIDPESYRTMLSGWLGKQNATILSYDYKYPQGRPCCSFWIATDTLQFITIHPNYEITFGELVDILGPPDYVSPGVVERTDYGLVLTWLDLCLYASGPIDRKEFERFRETLLVDPNLVVDEFIMRTYTLINNRDRSVEHPWNGFISD